MSVRLGSLHRGINRGQCHVLVSILSVLVDMIVKVKQETHLRCVVVHEERRCKVERSCQSQAWRGPKRSLAKSVDHRPVHNELAACRNMQSSQIESVWPTTVQLKWKVWRQSGLAAEFAVGEITCPGQGGLGFGGPSWSLTSPCQCSISQQACLRIIEKSVPIKTWLTG